MVENLCEKFQKVLPFLTTNKKNLQELMQNPDLEPIITGLVIPYLDNLEENRNHVSNCDRCFNLYEDFLTRQRIETGESRFDLDNLKLKLYS